MMVAAAASTITACGGTPPYSTTPSAAEARRLIEAGPGSNIATAHDQPNANLQPFRVRLPLEQARAALLDRLSSLPRWSVAGQSDSVVWATRTTRIFRFVDDVLIVLEPHGDSTTIAARSASRLGKGDLGQNRRNLAELGAAIEGK